MDSNKFDVLIWAHSDQQGGTEIPCVILKALKEIAGPLSKVGILTPWPAYVNDFFTHEAIKRDEDDVIQTQQFLALVVEGGRVNAEGDLPSSSQPAFY